MKSELAKGIASDVVSPFLAIGKLFLAALMYVGLAAALVVWACAITATTPVYYALAVVYRAIGHKRLAELAKRSTRARFWMRVTGRFYSP